MVQMEQADELVQEPQMAPYFVQDAAGPVCPLECMPGLLIAHIILKSRMNREVHVRFREEQGVKSPLLTRLVAVLSHSNRYYIDLKEIDAFVFSHSIFKVPPLSEGNIEIVNCSTRF